MKRLRHWAVSLVLGSLAVVGLTPGASARAPSASPVGDVEVMLTIDTSGSMGLAIEAAKAAANEFITSLPPQVPIGVVTFGDEVTVLSPPTIDRALLASLINGISAGGDTALYDAVIASTAQFAPGVEHKVLVLLSDGKDEGSVATLQDAVAAVQGITVEAIALVTSQADLTSLSFLGRVTPADDAAGVSAAYARVISLLADEIPTVLVPSTTVAATDPTTATPSTQPPVATTRAAPPSPSKAPLWLGGLGVFAGLFALGILLFPRARASKARLGINKPRSVSALGQRTLSAVDEVLERRGQRAKFATTLAVAGISMQPGEFLGTVGIVALISGLVGLAFWGALMGLLIAAAVCASVRFYILHARAKSQQAFADQLPDVLRLVTTGLLGGFGLTQALDMVAEEAEEPARSEFAHVLVEARLGRDLSDAMRALARRIDSRDLEWVVAAIDINRETGGNLSEILGTVGATIRERQRMARQVATLTAEGRLSARILTALPLLVALWQWRSNPKTFALLTHGGGLAALIIAGVLLVIGTLWTHRIVNSISS